MAVRSFELQNMEKLYQRPGNGLLFLFGNKNCGKEQLLSVFLKNKKTLYYRAGVADAKKQRETFLKEAERELNRKFRQGADYLEAIEYYAASSGEKKVLVIDEVQNMAKKDIAVLAAAAEVRDEDGVESPIFIVLCSSSILWTEKELPKLYPAVLRKADKIMKIKDYSFLDIVRAFPDYSTSQCVEVYGVIGGVPEFVERWNKRKTIKENICEHILSPTGFLFGEVERFLGTELRELSVYNTILASLAEGNNKLNDLYGDTEYSRAKISVYLKNLMEFDVIEKVVSFETGGWENAKKGIYQIKNHFVHFWFTFVFPNLSALYRMEPEEFYETYIERNLDDYMKVYFTSVCLEYLELLNMVGKLPIKIEKTGTWVGKQGTIDIVAQDAAGISIVGLCNWTEDFLSESVCMKLEANMKKAKIKANHIFLFSAKDFEDAVKKKAAEDSRFVLVDMNEL